MFSSMGSTCTIVAGNGTDAFSIIMHVHSSFKRDRVGHIIVRPRAFQCIEWHWCYSQHDVGRPRGTLL